MIVRTVQGIASISNKGISGAIYREYTNSSESNYSVDIMYTTGMITIDLPSKQSAIDLIEKIDSIGDSKEKTEIDNFKEAIEYALKLAKD